MSVHNWVRWFNRRDLSPDSSNGEVTERALREFREMALQSRAGTLRQGTPLEEYPSLQTFEFIETERANGQLDGRTKEFLDRGCTIKQLSRHEVLAVMKEHAVIQLGSFYATDEKVLRAFADKAMLTRGSETLYDPAFETNWKKELQESCSRSRSAPSNLWKDKVKLSAYAIRIENIADYDHGSALEVILQKQDSGAASKKIWEFPSVMALITYHWDHWTQLLMYLYFALFLVWLSSYVLFLIVYIDMENNKSVFHGGKTGQQLIGHVANFISWVFMLPSLLEIVLSVASQGASYIRLENLLDIAPVTIQIFISFCHAFDLMHNKFFFELLLVTQCVLLFTKVQQFGSAIGRSSHISFVFVQVMYDVRYMLFYIIYSTFSAALCLGILYKRDQKFQRADEIGHHYQSFKNALVSTFGVTFGNFDVDYVLEASHFWIKAAFFLGFQTYMTITVLNLLIAVMSTSYSKVEKKLGNKHERTRAEVIHSLQSIGVTKLFRIELPRYIHLLVAESALNDVFLSGEMPDSPSDDQDLTADVQQLTTAVQRLRQEIKKMSEDNEKKLQTLMSTIESMNERAAPSDFASAARL